MKVVRRLLRRMAAIPPFRSRPSLAPALRMVAQYVRHRPGPRTDHAVWKTAWEQIVRRPLLFRDSDGLTFVLEPDQNEQVYVASEGNYERAEVALCRSLLKREMVAFDVGANIGMYTLLFAKLVGEAGSVHAFEPEPRNFDRLGLHLTLNGLSNVTLNRLAVFSHSAPVTLNVFPSQFNAWHSIGSPELDNPYEPGETVSPEARLPVDGVSLDDYCREHGVEQIDLLKIDVEGAELEVIEGAAQLIGAGAVERILFEVSLPQIKALGHSPQAPFKRLAELGMVCHGIEEDGGVGLEIPRAEAEYANYIAFRKSSS